MKKPLVRFKNALKSAIAAVMSGGNDNLAQELGTIYRTAMSTTSSSEALATIAFQTLPRLAESIYRTGDHELAGTLARLHHLLVVDLGNANEPAEDAPPTRSWSPLATAESNPDSLAWAQFDPANGAANN